MATGAADTGPPLERRLAAIQRGASVALILLGVTVMFGWFLDLPALHPGRSTTTFTTALGFALAGLALYGLGPAARTASWRRARWLSIALSTLAAATLLQYPLGHPGRMSGFTATSFLLIGVATWMDAASTRARDAGRNQYSVIVLCLIGLLGILGFIYQAPRLLGFIPGFGTLSLVASLGILTAALALALVRPDGAVGGLLVSPRGAGTAARSLLFGQVVLLLLFIAVSVALENAGELNRGEAAATRNLAIYAVLLISGWRALRRADATELANVDDLKAAQALVQERDRDLETLLHVTSHDLREPLRSIESFSKMTRERYPEKLDQTGADYLDRVIRAAGRMNGLIDDIMRLSKARRAKVTPEPVDAMSLIDDVRERLERRIHDTGARVIVEPDLPLITVDRNWATQALCNLVDNALKFSTPGATPVVTISGYQQDGDVGIMVADRGPGVDPEHRERIFELFQRAVGRDVEGSGAGLAIVQQVALRHAGRAWMQPREGGGSEFVITFGRQSSANWIKSPRD